MGKFVVLQIIAGIIGAVIASIKRRNVPFWFLLCFLFPLVVFIISILPKLQPVAPLKRCPACLRPLNINERSCRHCQPREPIELVQCKQCGGYIPAGDSCPACQKKTQTR